MEAVTGVASRMILVLHVGTGLTVADVEGNVAVVARELAVKTTDEGNLGVLEGGEGNGEAVEHVVGSEHLSLPLRGCDRGARSGG